MKKWLQGYLKSWWVPSCVFFAIFFLPTIFLLFDNPTGHLPPDLFFVFYVVFILIAFVGIFVAALLQLCRQQWIGGLWNLSIIFFIVMAINISGHEGFRD